MIKRIETTYTLILVVRVCAHAAGQGMVFWPRRPKQGIQFGLPLSSLSLTGLKPVLNSVWYYEPTAITNRAMKLQMVRYGPLWVQMFHS